MNKLAAIRMHYSRLFVNPIYSLRALVLIVFYILLFLKVADSGKLEPDSSSDRKA